MSDTDPREVYDRALESHRVHYRDLRKIAATLVYLRIKLEAEHPEQCAQARRQDSPRSRTYPTRSRRACALTIFFG